MTSRSGGRPSIGLTRRSAGRAARRAARRSAAIEAVGLRDASAGDVEGGAVVGRGAHEGQAEGDVDAVVEGDGLDRDQRLVVIHGERGVVAGARAAAWNIVSAG